MNMQRIILNLKKYVFIVLENGQKHVIFIRDGKCVNFWLEEKKWKMERLKQISKQERKGQVFGLVIKVFKNILGLPSGVKLITVPSLEIDSKPNKRIFYLNPQGKTSVSILHGLLFFLIVLI